MTFALSGTGWCMWRNLERLTRSSAPAGLESIQIDGLAECVDTLTCLHLCSEAVLCIVPRREGAGDHGGIAADGITSDSKTRGARRSAPCAHEADDTVRHASKATVTIRATTVTHPESRRPASIMTIA